MSAFLDIAQLHLSWIYKCQYSLPGTRFATCVISIIYCFRGYSVVLSSHPPSPTIPGDVESLGGAREEIAGRVGGEGLEFAVGGGVLAAWGKAAATIGRDVKSPAGAGEDFPAVLEQVAERAVGSGIGAVCHPRASSVPGNLNDVSYRVDSEKLVSSVNKLGHIYISLCVAKLSSVFAKTWRRGNLFVRFPPVVLDAEHLTVVGDGLALEMRTIVTQLILYIRELGIEFVFFRCFRRVEQFIGQSTLQQMWPWLLGVAIKKKRSGAPLDLFLHQALDCRYKEIRDSPHFCYSVSRSPIYSQCERLTLFLL